MNVITLSNMQGISMNDENTTPNEFQLGAITALRDICDRRKLDWKEELSFLWMSGKYRGFGLNDKESSLLQQIRNQLGPKWLRAVTDADLDALDHDVPVEEDGNKYATPSGG